MISVYMKNEILNKKVSFDSLEIGDGFVDNDNDICVKVSEECFWVLKPIESLMGRFCYKHMHPQDEVIFPYPVKVKIEC